MQITSNEISNTKYMQIYLTEEELKKQETKAKIEKYKKELIKIKRKIRCNVSKSEYEICKKDLNALKEKYNFSNDEIWDFGYICGYIDILRIDRIK